MTNTVLLKRSGTASAAPTSTQITYGELAINYTDGNLFFKDSSDQVKVLASTKFVSVTGNVTGGNIVSLGQVSASGNISGNYFIGNGAFLTGISGGGGNIISNGTSNVVIPVANGSVYINDGSVSNAAVFSNGSLTLAGSFATPRTITQNSTIEANVNAMLVGPVEFAPGVTITVPSSSSLSISPDEYANSNVSTYLASGTNAANIITTANISGNYILGNGYYLTGISGGGASTYSNANVSTYLASGTNSANIVTTANVSGGNITTSGLVSATANITGGNLLTAGLVSVAGNITSAANISGNYILGNGSQLTGLPATYSNTNVSSFLAAFGSNTISTTGTVTAGNITGANILTGGLISATSNITSAANVTGGNILTAGLVSATGNISANYFIGNGSLLTGITASGGTPAGSNTQIQFNDAGSFGASSNLTFNKTTNTLNANVVTANGVPLATTGKAIAMAIVFGF